MSSSSTNRTSMALAILGPLLALVLAGMLGEASRVGRPVPISGLMMLVLLLLSKPIIGIPVAAAVISLAYLGWVRPAMTGRVHYSTLTWLALAVLLVLSVSWYRVGWTLGMKWDGPTYTLGCAVIGVVLFAGVLLAGLAARRFASPKMALLGRWLALVWVVTYGYPWLGELL